MSVPRAKTLYTNQSAADIEFLVHGQGVFMFETQSSQKTTAGFHLFNKELKGLYVEFGNGYVHVSNINESLIDPDNTTGLINKSGAYYWFSLDTHNHRLYAGVGEPRYETVIYEYNLPETAINFLETIQYIKFTASSNIKPIKLLRDPITTSIPMLVKHSNDLTMNDVATGAYLPKANLSLVAQKLYDCIAGKNFKLDDIDFPEFSKAITQSIQNPNGWCYKRLLEKANEFSKEPRPQETYLRITLGQNNGESPGVPYVMEIWPVGHFSPIHSHSAANAVIRVLHGSIQVELFPFLCDEKDTVMPFGTENFTKEDITWISPTLNQIHRLTNLPTNIEPCITIQCYMYNEDDDAHYDYFDYLGDNGKKLQYTPDSDMDFVMFKQLMKTEWQQVF